MKELLVRLRRYLITGLVVIAPVFITIAVLLWLFNTLDAILGRYLQDALGRRFPGLGVVALLILLLGIGWVSQKALGQRAVATGNRIVSRLPVIRKIYNASSQIVQSILDRDEKLFRACALIEYPTPGSYSLVFVTAEAPGRVSEHLGEPATSVFLPTVPNPTTGYLLILPSRSVHTLDMSVEEGFKMVLSAGVAVPEPDRLQRRSGGGTEATPGGPARPPPGPTGTTAEGGAAT